MKTRILFFILLAIIILDSVIFSQTQPHYKPIQYTSELWRVEGSTIGDDAFPDTGLFAITDAYPNEPFGCYPFHSGHVKGISDTTVFIVHFKNYNSTSYDISTQQPHTWFTPVLYEENLNPRFSNPKADTSQFDIGFQYWSNWGDDIVTQPTSIPSVGGGNEQYLLIYYVWNLPVGRNRLVMKKTAAAPSGFKLLVSNSGVVWVTNAKDLGDTLNAYGSCYWRAHYADNLTTALSWTDTMLTYNQYSIPGYLLKAYAHSDLGDSLEKVTALDSVIAIGERYGDPVVPDTSDMNMYWQMWYDDIMNHAKYYRWKHITGNEKISNL